MNEMPWPNLTWPEPPNGTKVHISYNDGSYAQYIRRDHPEHAYQDRWWLIVPSGEHQEPPLRWESITRNALTIYVMNLEVLKPNEEGDR